MGRGRELRNGIKMREDKHNYIIGNEETKQENEEKSLKGTWSVGK